LGGGVFYKQIGENRGGLGEGEEIISNYYKYLYKINRHFKKRGMRVSSKSIEYFYSYTYNSLGHQAICKIFDNEVGKSRMELSLS